MHTLLRKQNEFLYVCRESLAVPGHLMIVFIKLFYYAPWDASPVVCISFQLHTYLITCLHKKHNLRTIITLLTYTCPTKERWGFESSLSLFCFLLILVSLSLSLIEKSLLAETISSMVGIIVLWPLILFISKRSMNENHMSTKAALSGPLHT